MPAMGPRWRSPLSDPERLTSGREVEQTAEARSRRRRSGRRRLDRRVLAAARCLPRLRGLLRSENIALLKRLPDLAQRTAGIGQSLRPGDIRVSLLCSAQVSGGKRRHQAVDSLLALLPLIAGGALCPCSRPRPNDAHTHVVTRCMLKEEGTSLPRWTMFRVRSRVDLVIRPAFARLIASASRNAGDNSHG